MSYVPGSRSSSHDYGGENVTTVQDFFRTFSELVRRHGLKGVVVIALAAVAAFAPLMALYWLNELRFASVLSSNHGPVVVRPGRFEQAQQNDQPGKTALLQVICEVRSSNETQTLMIDADPRHNDVLHGSTYVRNEMVYIRPAGIHSSVPFGLLGKPPVSAWLPAGEYEILIVHDAPSSESFGRGRVHRFPLVSVRSECKLENKQKTVCRVLLPHHGFNQGFVSGETEPEPTRDEIDAHLATLSTEWNSAIAVPTPAGYLLALAEPVIQHHDDHHRCTIDYGEREAVPREWTRDQLAAVRNWLPSDTPAAKKLSALVDAIGWRDIFRGWYCYAAAGITGLIFSRWGAIRMLEPWRRNESFFDNLGLLIKIFCISVGVWFAYCVLTDSSGCSGPVRFRLH